MSAAAPASPQLSTWQQIKAKGLRGYFWDTNIEEAAPAERHIQVAGYPMQKRLPNGQTVDVGTLFVELYLMAQAGTLPQMVKAKALFNKPVSEFNKADSQKLAAEKPALYKSLFHPDGTMKAHWELALIPSYNYSYLQAYLTKVYGAVIKQGNSLPSSHSKVRVGPDFLANFEKVGLVQKTDGRMGNKPAQEPTSGEYCFGSFGVYLTLKNPPHTATKREKIMHFLGPWIAWLVTVSAAIAMSGVTTTPLMLAFYALGTYIAMACANEFDMFDKAESLYRDLGWMFSKEYRQHSKFSLKNTLHALVQLAAIAFIAWGAAQAAWTGILSLPFLQWAPQIEMAIAAFFGSVAAVGTFVGLAGAIRYIRGISPFDNQIPAPSDESVARLKVVTKDSEKAIKRAMKEVSATELRNILDLGIQQKANAQAADSAADLTQQSKTAASFTPHAASKQSKEVDAANDADNTATTANKPQRKTRKAG